MCFGDVMNDLIQPVDEFVDIGFQMHIRRWQPQAETEKHPVLLVHGLSSNAKTWDGVGQRLAAQGYDAVAIDQRSHGLSDVLSDAYDFDTITDDLIKVLDHLGWQDPILVGQSWGGNVMLAFGSRFPNRATGLVFVDGGFLNVGGNGEAWEEIHSRLMPQALDRVPVSQMAGWLRSAHPDWSDVGIEGTLGNFEHHSDGTLSRRLPIPDHMEIVRHLYEQNPIELYPQVLDPVLIYVAGSDADWESRKKKLIKDANAMQNVEVHRFVDGDHDIHVQKPEEFVSLFLDWMSRRVI